MKVSNFTPEDIENAEGVAEHLEHMLAYRNPYSERLRIKSDGTFDIYYRIDGSPMYLTDVGSPYQFYILAQIIESSLRPDWKFEFIQDPEGQWLEYKVTVQPTPSKP